MGYDAAKIHENISGTTRSGTALVFSPRLSPLTCELLIDPRGLVTSALLQLPGLQPVLVMSIYAPPHDEAARSYIVSFISPLLRTYPLHILLGDFNALIHHQLDSEGVTSPNCWPWLSTSFGTPSPTHIDTFRDRQLSQHEGLSGIRTSDHLLHLKATSHSLPNTYHLYIAFERAFNSIPIKSLFQTLSYYNLSSALINSIKHLYTFTTE